MEATLRAPDAATIMNTANTWGRPHTIWLFMPVMMWPWCSMVKAARSPSRASSPRPPSSAQYPGLRPSISRLTMCICVIRSNALVAYAGIAFQGGPGFPGRELRQFPGDFAGRIVQVAKQDGLMAFRLAGFGAGGGVVAGIDLVDTKGTRLHATLAAGGVGHLGVMQVFMHQRAGLVGAGHHAVAAGDANMPVHQDNSIGALERRTSRAHVHTGRLLAVLAHQGQIVFLPGALVGELHLADPLRILRAGFQGPAILGAARGHTGIATGSALGRVDEQAPAVLAGHTLLGRAPLGNFIKQHARQGRGAAYCEGAANKVPAVLVKTHFATPTWVVAWAVF